MMNNIFSFTYQIVEIFKLDTTPWLKSGRVNKTENFATLRLTEHNYVVGIFSTLKLGSARCDWYMACTVRTYLFLPICNLRIAQQIVIGDPCLRSLFSLSGSD